MIISEKTVKEFEIVVPEAMPHHTFTIRAETSEPSRRP